MKTAYHHLSSEQVLKELNSSKNGLSEDEATARLSRIGENIIPTSKPYSIPALLLDQLKDAMIFILLIAAFIAGLLGEWIDAAIIFTIVFINSLTGFLQAYHAEKAIEAIRRMATIKTNVIRGNKLMSIDAAALVPGDIVTIEAGNIISADLRLLESATLLVDESALTGESISVYKSVQELPDGTVAVSDQVNMAFKGTIAVRGRAKGIVVYTGRQTEIGKIASMLDRKKLKTPLQQRMAKFSKNLSVLILIICTILFVLGWLRGEKPFPMLLVAVSLAVAAIPEALPALVTIALAKGASRLVKQNALIRKLPAVETLGSVNTICTDKTGTITQNKMSVQRLQSSDEVLRSQLFLAMILNSDALYQAGIASGDPTETALMDYVVKHMGEDYVRTGRHSYPRIAEIGFTAERKCMSTFHADGSEGLLICKGSAEQIMERLASSELDKALVQLVNEWSAAGLRVLAFAYRPLKIEETKTIGAHSAEATLSVLETNLVLLGYVGISDPPRKEVIQAIKECRQAGIRVVMITGDHPETARAISADIGLSDNQNVLSGYELTTMSHAQLKNCVLHTSVFARVSPAQKLDIVTALQSQGQFVAMTGDGVNDAPALKASNIGIAMGIAGSDVSREAADMILLDDNFTTIVKAIKEGRRIFDNIRKFVRYIMTCNSAEILTLFLAPLLGLPLPLLPVHILWINLVTDGLPGIALASEKGEPDIMQRPPRPAAESLFAHGSGTHIIWVGSLMAAVTLVVQAVALNLGNVHWQTMVFTVLSFSQLGHVMAIRSEKVFLFRQGLFSNKPLIVSIIVTLILQLTVIYLPAANTIFKTQPLSLVELSLCVFAASIVFHAVEIEKWIKARKPAVTSTH